MNTLQTTMRTVLLTAALLGALSAPAAATPATMSLAGTLGDAPTTGVYTLRVALYDGEFGGAAFWQSLQSAVVIDSHFDIVIGRDLANPLIPSDFIDASQVWMGISVVDSPTFGTQEPEIPRRMLVSVGYAFAAHHASRAGLAEHADTAATATLAAHATSAGHATTATLATHANSATHTAHATAATTADEAVSAQLATHATQADTADEATSATTAANADSATVATRATAAGLASSAAMANTATTADLADKADNATSAQSAMTADHAANAATVTSATNVQSAVTATTATNATNASTATTADTAQSAISATTADYAVRAASVTSATTAQTATTASRVNVATTATTAEHAQNAATAASASSLSCVACITLAHLSFDPATQAELEAKLATITIPTRVDGLAGGSVAGDVTVLGNVSATALKQSGNDVCDASGNCGAILAGLACADGANTPKWDPDEDAWVCASDAVDAADSALAADTALNLTCPACVSQAELGFDITTQGELAAAVQGITVPTTVNGLAGGEIDGSVTVSGQLAATGFTQAGEALCDASGNCGTTLATLSCPAGATKARYNHDTDTWTCVQNRVAVADTAGSAQSAGSVGSVSCVGCVSADELAVDPATQGEMDAAVAALTATIANLQVPTSIDGFGGGTLTSALTVQGGLQAGDGVTTTAMATAIRQDGRVICDTSGNCGQTLSSLGCRTNQTIAYDVDAGKWACAEVGGGGSVPPGDACTGLDEIKHWTGSAWECRSIHAVGATGEGRANGYRAIDDWGDAWDGIERAPRYWADAKAECEAEGGRLPTATELWRNSANWWEGGRQNVSGSVGRHYDTNYLWAMNPHESVDDYIAVRLSDGSRTNYDGPTTRRPFRCTWPSQSPTGFDGNKCFGPPGEECKSYQRVWNVDRMDRAPIPEVSANWECNFYNASLLRIDEASDLIKDGWDGATNAYWRRSGNYLYVYNNAYRQALYLWHTDPEPQFGFDNGTHGWGDEGGTTDYNSWYRFRCIGKKSAAVGTPPADPPCWQGQCFTVTNRKSPLVIDAIERSAVEYQHASEACRLLGGSLPTAQELHEAILNGLPNGSNKANWTSTPIYWYSGHYGYWMWIWPGTGHNRWYTTAGHNTLHKAWEDAAYRCVWRETVEDAFTTCAAAQVQSWDGATMAYTCVDAVDGTSAGQANAGTEYKDAWGNVWDGVVRGNLVYDEAKAACESLGARLPLSSELYRVRANQAVVPTAVATATDVEYVWTLTPSYHGDHNVTMRPSDGDVTHHAWSTPRPFYCLWESTKGDQLSGNACYGEPGAPCFEAPSSRLRVDRYDRPRVWFPSAAFDCNYQGGRVPTGDDWNHMTHAGIPNGSPSTSDPRWSWMSEHAYFYDGGYGTKATFWVGTGDATWEYRDDYNATVDWEHTRRYFRCVFSDKMD